MLIAVIVPVYKVEPYLHRCIDSILSQTFTDFELVLVEDGSPDNCGKICDEYAARDNRVCVLHQENGGLSAARNAGMDYVIHKGKSKWITFIDSDDWVASDYLEQLLNLCKKYDSDIGICRLLRCKEQPASMMDISVDYLATPYDALVYQGGVACYAWARLYRTDLIAKYRFPVGMFMEDFYIIPEIILAAKRIAVTERQLYYYFINETSILGTLSLKKFQNAWKGYERQLELFSNRGEDALRKMQTNAYIHNISAAYSFAKQHSTECSKDDIKAIKSHGKKIIKKYKDDLDLSNANTLRALATFSVFYHYKISLFDIWNNSGFFIIRGLRGIFYRFVFPHIKQTRISQYNKKLRKKLNHSDFSIICSNCIGGFIYHRLGLKFLSPTINCFIEPSDFIKFCKRLKYYLSLNLEFVRSDKPYPVAKLDDITVFFNHSETEKDAEEMWNKRKGRVNYENLYIIIYNRYSSNDSPLTKDELLEAGNIPCKNLIILSDVPCPDLPYVLYIPKKDSDLGQLYFDSDKYGVQTFEKEFDFVSFLNK